MRVPVSRLSSAVPDSPLDVGPLVPENEIRWIAIPAAFGRHSGTLSARRPDLVALDFSESMTEELTYLDLSASTQAAGQTWLT